VLHDWLINSNFNFPTKQTQPMIGFQQQKKKEQEGGKATKSVTALKGGDKKVKKITAAELR
jgi:hypothetical protein